MLEGEADIGLGFFVKPAVGLLRQPLCKFRLMRISPPGGHGPRRASGRASPGAASPDLPLVSLPADNPIQALIEKHLARIGRTHDERPGMNLIGTLIGMVRAGLGHAVVPSFALEECLRHGLGVAMLVEPVVHLDLFLVSRRGAQPKPASLEFAAALNQAASRLTG